MLLDRIPELTDIQEAAKRIKPYTHVTPILTSQNLDQVAGCKVFFKCENLQKAGAFKSRGACNAVFSLDEDEVCDGVATHSSGNHAQALARAAQLRNVKSYIVMPKNAPQVKVSAVRYYKGEITFCEPNLPAREESLKSVILETGAYEIHPYNNYCIIAGQATATLEIFNQLEAPDYLIAPVGGGGLLSGTALANSYLSRKTKVIGAEPIQADDAFRSLKEGRILPSLHPKTIADGLLTSLGNKTFPLIREYVHEIITVQEESILKAMRLIWERMKIIVEPSAAVPFAVLLEQKAQFAGKKVVIILSGGNIDLEKIPWNHTH
jgi:threonine dehydratase